MPILLSAYEDFTRLYTCKECRTPIAACRLLRKLRRLHDHKGDLGVVWNTTADRQ